MSEKTTLAVMLASRESLEEKLEDVLTYSNELEALWAKNEIDIKAKIDAYGHVLDELKDHIERLKNRKTRIDEINKSLTNEIERIKANLNHHADNKPLKGDEYSFHPYISQTRVIEDLDNVESSLKSFTIAKLSYSEIEALKQAVDGYCDANPDEIKEDKTLRNAIDSVFSKLLEAKASCNVTDLPDNHPAIITKLTPSVRVR